MMSKNIKDSVVMMLTIGKMEWSATHDPYHESMAETDHPEVQGIGPGIDEFNPFDDEHDEFKLNSVSHFTDYDE